MRHFVHHRKFCRTSSHRAAMLKNLSVSLLTHERIVTTLAKAKDLRPYVEKIITCAKSYKHRPSFNFNRRIISKLGHSLISDKLVNVLADRYKERFGGYTRIIKCGFRKGDNAPMAVIELLDSKIVGNLGSSNK